ncbi:ABC transporter permease [Tenuibacillus multivorans]|uniref:Osmoprotectant transport system permease protein n=1 Tax=Tenuibacillus multivorans TaxID=237069 RepID=A0A1H0DK97_9BACI|nr:ABC transporter permease [Tenuibacillus multivorans]GEL76513.1 ABC transporter permease [Tenuibacillus multivorans]SDN70677.1 osmoprotectant transport system permease protein [Tenuibacillus multivorans]
MNSQKVITWTVRVFIYFLVIAFFYWTIKNQYFSYIFENIEQFKVLVIEHLQIVGLSSAMAILVSIPSAILVTRPKFKRLEGIVSTVANFGYTIPNMAILALMMGVLGIGFKTAVFALFLYSILPIYRNTVAGIHSVNPNLIDAAKGIGFKPHQILFRVELPNAAYAIIAGVRTAVVINIGATALAYLIGGGGLGNWIFMGIKVFDDSILLSGAVTVTLLAVITDYLLRGVERLVVPKGTKRS